MGQTINVLRLGTFAVLLLVLLLVVVLCTHTC
jgi:hypothetical protein